MIYLKKYWLYLLVLILAVLIFISLIYLQIIQPKKKEGLLPKPTILYPTTAIPSPYPLNPQSVQEFNTQTEQKIIQDTQVAKLISDLPFQNQFFKIDFSFSRNLFEVTFYQMGPESNLQFDNFLKSYNILNRYWLGKVIYD